MKEELIEIIAKAYKDFKKEEERYMYFPNYLHIHFGFKQEMANMMYEYFLENYQL